MIGAWVGAAALPAALFVAFASGTCAVFPFVLAGRLRRTACIPFGPALAAGGVAALFAGRPISATLFGLP